MQERHRNRKQYFDEQSYTTENYVIPYFQDYLSLTGERRVLEIGCGEGGNLQPFLDRGCTTVGVDISAKQIERADAFYQNHPNRNCLHLIAQDIYEISPAGLGGPFDLIFMRDVIEHIHDQDRFLEFVRPFLHDAGVFFLGFPPWYNPFGGHQQVCNSKVLSKAPWIHLLPVSAYRVLLKAFGETDKKVDDLLEIKETGISIERFERLLKKKRYATLRKTHFLVNPNYEVKFGLKPRKQLPFATKVPFLRNFYTTCAYYLVSKD